MATLELEAPAKDEPLNQRQLAFARELGPALAKGGRDDDILAAYVAAGYAPDRGNARRLASDPRVVKIANEALAEANRLSGLHIGYLQAKALELLQASPTKIFRAIQLYEASKRTELSDEARQALEAAIDEVTWPLNEFKIDKDGIITIKLPDKKGIIEMLSKQLGVGKEENNTTVQVTLEQLIAASMKTTEKAA